MENSFTRNVADLNSDEIFEIRYQILPPEGKTESLADIRTIYARKSIPTAHAVLERKYGIGRIKVIHYQRKRYLHDEYTKEDSEAFLNHSAPLKSNASGSEATAPKTL